MKLNLQKNTSSGRVTWRSDELTALAQAWRWPEWQEERFEELQKELKAWCLG